MCLRKKTLDLLKNRKNTVEYEAPFEQKKFKAFSFSLEVNRMDIKKF